MTLTSMAAPAAPSTVASPSRRLTRDDIVALGRSGRAWEFLPVAEQALRLAPEDAGLLVLAAANAARLGLRTAAAEWLAAVPSVVRGDAAVRQLEEVVQRLADDRIGYDERVARCRANVGVVREKVTGEERAELDAALGAWVERTKGEEWCRSTEGNIVRRVGGAWMWTGDLVGLTRAGKLPEGEAPITVEGVDPPWLVRRVIRETPRRGDGFWRRVRVVEPDLTALCNGLACADLREELGQGRVGVFIGSWAAERLARDLDARMGTQIAGPTLALPGVQRAGGGTVSARVITDASTRQVGREERLLAEVAAIYRGRDRAWWGRRFAEALEGRGEALRVLIPTHRFSTFVRHSAADLAAALRAAGCEVEVLMEPDDSSLLATVGYLEAMRRVRPDLVVMINYTRANLSRVVPAEVPVVCWIQDAMGHLFREEVGAGQTELDFVVGHLHPELFRHFGYPRERTLASPVVVSEAKFHDGEVEAGLAARLACEIAYAGNQSETPEACRDRLMRESAGSAASARVVGALYERIGEICGRGGEGTERLGEAIGPRLDEAVREELERAGVRPDGKVVTHAMNLWARPLADRVLRHETLRWAAEVAEANGWRLRIFGRGWESHPTLRRYACGVLGHGEELRASYRCAAVHLHASVNGWLHQRVLECALAGGLPLCRLRGDDLAIVQAWVFRSLIEHGTPWASWPPTRATLYLTCDNPEAMEAGALLQRLGESAPWYWSVMQGWAEDPSRYDGGMPVGRELAWLLGDMAETAFWSKRGLEAAVRRAVERPRWRDDVVRGIAQRARGTLTYGVLARRMLELVRAGLARSGTEMSGHRSEP